MISCDARYIFLKILTSFVSFKSVQYSLNNKTYFGKATLQRTPWYVSRRHVGTKTIFNTLSGRKKQLLDFTLYIFHESLKQFWKATDGKMDTATTTQNYSVQLHSKVQGRKVSDGKKSI